MSSRRQIVARVVALLVAATLAWAGQAFGVVSSPSSGTTMVAYSGTVDGPPESVFLSGFVGIKATVVRDPESGRPPIVLLHIDLSNVVGVGITTGSTYVASGDQDLIRPLAASDVVDVTFAIVPKRAEGALEARTALASFTLTFNVATGVLTRGVAATAVNVADRLPAASVP